MVIIKVRSDSVFILGHLKVVTVIIVIIIKTFNISYIIIIIFYFENVAFFHAKLGWTFAPG